MKNRLKVKGLIQLENDISVISYHFIPNLHERLSSVVENASVFFVHMVKFSRGQCCSSKYCCHRRKSKLYRFGRTWRWINDDTVFISLCAVPFSYYLLNHSFMSISITHCRTDIKKRQEMKSGSILEISFKRIVGYFIVLPHFPYFYI